MTTRDLEPSNQNPQHLEGFRDGGFSMMPSLHKKVLLALAAGTGLGWFFTAFVFYPPAPGWGIKEHWGDVATWSAACAAGVAAAATFYAARVALSTARDAIANERLLRAEEKKESQAEHRNREKALATVLLGPIFNLSRDAECWRLTLVEADIDIFDIVDDIRSTRTHVIDAFIGDLLILEGDALKYFGLAYGNIRSLIEAAQEVGKNTHWDETKKLSQKETLLQNLNALADCAYRSWKLFLEISSDFRPDADPRVAARRSADFNLASIRAKKRKRRSP